MAKAKAQYDPVELSDVDARRKGTEERQKQDRQVTLDDFKFIMGDRRGRRYIWRLLSSTGVFRSSFTGNSETFFREGMRNVGLAQMALIHEACPDKYAVMLREQNEYERRNTDTD